MYANFLEVINGLNPSCGHNIDSLRSDALSLRKLLHGMVGNSIFSWKLPLTDAFRTHHNDHTQPANRHSI